MKNIEEAIKCKLIFTLLAKTPQAKRTTRTINVLQGFVPPHHWESLKKKSEKKVLLEPLKRI